MTPRDNAGVNRVVEDAALEAEAEALAQRLAAGPPGAYAMTKALEPLEAGGPDGRQRCIVRPVDAAVRYSGRANGDEERRGRHGRRTPPPESQFHGCVETIERGHRLGGGVSRI
jgi:hypothetical protein